MPGWVLARCFPPYSPLRQGQGMEQSWLNSRLPRGECSGPWLTNWVRILCFQTAVVLQHARAPASPGGLSRPRLLDRSPSSFWDGEGFCGTSAVTKTRTQGPEPRLHQVPSTHCELWEANYSPNSTWASSMVPTRLPSCCPSEFEDKLILGTQRGQELSPFRKALGVCDKAYRYRKI